MTPTIYRPHNPLQKWIEAPLVLLIGGVGYTAIEVLWRGYSHPAMAVCGAICFYFVYRLCADHPRTPILLRALIGALFITATELFAGCLLNIALGLRIWDYSHLPYQFLGQISLHYSVAWFFLSLLLCGVSRAVRRLVFFAEI